MGAANMVLKMENVERRGDTYYVRMIIPPDIRASFNGKTAIWRSLRTKDENEARELAAPIISDIKRRIDAARLPASTSKDRLVYENFAVNPDAAYAAMERWQKRKVHAAYRDHFNRPTETIDLIGDEARALSNLRLALREARYGQIAGFDDALVEALTGEGIAIHVNHPAIPNLRHWFGQNWWQAEDHIQRFRERKFSGWPLDTAGNVLPDQSSELPTRTDRPLAISISRLLERFIESKRPAAKDESEIRGYVARLIQEIGDLPISEVSTDALDRFLVRLRKFPNTKRPDILKLSFGEIICRFGDDPDFPRLANKTLRTKWFGAFNRLFKFAVQIKILSDNPVSGSMPIKSDDEEVERDPWTAEEIGQMFSLPNFTGTSSKLYSGYRCKPGKIIQRDAKYWLPIVALFSGMRLEEIGGAKSADVREKEGFWFFDLTERRRLKNKNSARAVPIHPKLIELGFLDYAADQPTWLFPDLPHDGAKDDEGRTALFSKWFGRWRAANGFPNGARKKDFHSFRHTFIDACRDAEMNEQTQDFITGHAGTGSQGRKYGSKKTDPKVLGRAMATVRYPTFPNLPRPPS